MHAENKMQLFFFFCYFLGEGQLLYVCKLNIYMHAVLKILGGLSINLLLCYINI
jgi:hypothetical protein